MRDGESRAGSIVINTGRKILPCFFSEDLSEFSTIIKRLKAHLQSRPRSLFCPIQLGKYLGNL